MHSNVAPLAAAQDPQHRLAWADTRAEALHLASPHLQWESLTARLALTWAGTSSHATDALWSAQAAPGVSADLLLVLPGHQTDPLAQALLARWGAHGGLLAWPEPDAAPPRLQACGDAEDEAHWAAACVIEHLNAGRSPVALVAPICACSAPVVAPCATNARRLSVIGRTSKMALRPK